MSPKLGERAAPPPPVAGWDVRYGTNDAAKGWEELCRHAPRNMRRAWDEITSEPVPGPASSRHHQLRTPYSHRAFKGSALEQWQYEVTGGGRIWYLVDEPRRILWVWYAGVSHPKATE